MRSARRWTAFALVGLVVAVYGQAVRFPLL
jgi:hypothetical protein